MLVFVFTKSISMPSLTVLPPISIMVIWCDFFRRHFASAEVVAYSHGAGTVPVSSCPSGASVRGFSEVFSGITRRFHWLSWEDECNWHSITSVSFWWGITLALPVLFREWYGHAWKGGKQWASGSAALAVAAHPYWLRLGWAKIRPYPIKWRPFLSQQIPRGNAQRQNLMKHHGTWLKCKDWFNLDFCAVVVSAWLFRSMHDSEWNESGETRQKLEDASLGHISLWQSKSLVKKSTLSQTI